MPAKLEAALVGGDNSPQYDLYITHFALQQLRTASDWHCRFFSLRPFSLACNSYLLDVMDGNWSLLVLTGP
jgi:hypothetical protein